MFFAFDVDGTLTPSRQKISPQFEDWFLSWIADVQNWGGSVLLVTGSDRPKTVEQLGEKIVDAVDYCCNCMGNTVYKKGQIVYDYKFDYPPELVEFLNNELNSSVYSERYGNHIEDRGAMFNYSTVGRNANIEQRKRYHEWDAISNERVEIARRLNEQFELHSIVAQVAGEIGIDITAKGRDKRQCIKYMQGDIVLFFGDRMDDNGNDKPLADAVNQLQNGSRCYEVEYWEETWDILQNLGQAIG
jgi:phosphomannomutase